MNNEEIEYIIQLLNVEDLKLHEEEYEMRKSLERNYPRSTKKIIKKLLKEKYYLMDLIDSILNKIKILEGASND